LQGQGEAVFIKHSSKFDYFYGRVATFNANNIENPAISLWIVGCSKRRRDALLLVWFWRKPLQGQGEAVFIKHSSKLDYFYGRVATFNANNIENPASSLWFVGYSKPTRDALSLVWFWRKPLQGQGQAVLLNILLNSTISTAV
jgi:hypothetical protein